MPIDASIPLQIRPPALDDPLTLQSKQLQLRDLVGQQQMREMQMQQAQRAQQQDMTLADLYRQSGGDPTKLRSGMAERGLGARIPEFDKQQASLGKDTADAEYKKLQSAGERLKITGGALSSLLSNPNVSHNEVIQAIVGLTQNGIISPEQGQQMVNQLPGRPEQLRPFLLSKGMEVMDASKRIEMQLPKVEYKQTGKQMVPVDLNPMTNPNPQALTMTTTPGEDMTDARTRAEGAANRGVTMRGQDNVDARAREAAQAGKVPSGYRYKADGTLEAIPGGPAAEKLSDPKQKVSDATEALALINQAGPMLKSSTGSTVGMVIDKMVGAFGYSTPGSISAQSLKALEGALIGKMPKMSGPQSDKDVQLYRQMAAVVGDDTVPYAQKVAALETVREIQERQAGMKPGSSRPAAPAKPGKPNQALHDQADAILRGD